jgi:hypothetical protein
VLLDPPGHSAAHGAALEQQASLLLTTYYLLLTTYYLLLTTYYLLLTTYYLLLTTYYSLTSSRPSYYLLLTTYYLLLTNEQQAILLLTTYLQAIGRAVRMGQQHPVTVTRLCVTGTLEGTLTLARALALTL